jgi:diguanylate cyclase (GGDEF)-like protein/PAS domain S-box-containing protein
LRIDDDAHMTAPAASLNASASSPEGALAALVDALPDPVFVKDRAHRWVYFNEAFCALLNQPREALYGRSDYDFLPPDEAEVFWQNDLQVLETGQENVNLERLTDASGNLRIVETKKRRVIIGGEPLIIGVIRDLTAFTQVQTQLAQANRNLEHIVHERNEELNRVTAQLQQLAFFDSLTTLPNRRLMFSAVERRLATPEKPFALFYLDLDNFKWVNDSLGHHEGDVMLVEIAERLRQLPNFSMIARVGGDEFVAIGHEDADLDQMSLAKRARELLSAVEQPIQADSRELSASFSVGIAVYPQDGKTVSQLLQCADSAMYRAKERGRNQYAFFARQQSVRAHEQMQLEAGLRRALKNRQIQIAFQPIFSAKTGQKVGVEALARWHDPELGVISPDRFVPVAESSGLIHELSSYVLRLSLRIAQRILPAPLRLGVNLSALQMDRMTLVEDIRRALTEAKFPANRLELEITESIAANRSERLVSVMRALKELGVSFALDDFGTGYSGLAHIQRLPIDRIKIDKSFIDDIESSAKARALVEAVIRMGHALDLEIIAEGVEREAQLHMLTRFGCDALQGYLMARPHLFNRVEQSAVALAT